MLLQRCDNIIITIENWHDTTTVKEVFVSGWILAYCISLYPFLTNANQLSRGGGGGDSHSNFYLKYSYSYF